MPTRALTAVVLALAMAGAVAVRADVLYTVNGSGLLRAIDPATGMTSQRTQIHVPDQAVLAVRGLGATTDGGAYALVNLDDGCTLDPTRTVFVGTSEYGCTYHGGPRDSCEQSYIVTWDGQPRPCTWIGGGCELCMECVNTCVPPPPCLGSARTQYAGAISDACWLFNGDASGCAAAYFSDNGSTATFSCYDSAGECLGCTPEAQAVGACTNECQPDATCADEARDLFTGSYGCGRLRDDVAACQRAFQTDGNVKTMTCVVGSDGYCTWCDANAEALGYCTNTCAVVPPCVDPTRTAVPVCYARDGDADGCAQAYTTGPDGEPIACLFNENAACVPCDAIAERTGKCINGCAPPVCDGDAQRTTLLEPPADCHVLDGDPSACAAAYFVGPCGVSSCHYDADSAGCRPCTLDDPERCENACGSFETTEAARAPALVAVQLASGEAAVVGFPGDSLFQPTPDASGTIYALTGNGCLKGSILRLDSTDLRPGLVASIQQVGSEALAVHPNGQLYRFDGNSLFATDPVTGLTTPVATDAPVWFGARAMTWAPACNEFLVADGFDGLWRVDPTAGTVVQTALRLEGECDEGDCAVGLALYGTSVCPPLTFPTFTTTTTSTSSTSSTSSTTLPSELITGQRLLITDDVDKPKKRRLEIHSQDKTITLGEGADSGDDPTLHGGVLRVVAASGTFAATYPLDGGWRLVRKGGRVKGYEYRGDGAIRRIAMRPGRLDVRGQGPDLVQPLLQDPSTVRVVLRLGGRRWCLAFGGTFGARTPRKLSARDAPAPPACGEP